jgi:small ligand-binding sensory domain FIST
VRRKSGYSVMRPTLLANLKEKSIFCGGVIEEGDVFRFSVPPDFDVIDDVIESSRKIKKTHLPDVDAMVIFSCAGRFESFGPLLDVELEGLAETWGSPMAGFLCLGEFGKVVGGDVSEFHGSTCSWMALKEKSI